MSEGAIDWAAKRHPRGFTLIELLVVILIVGVVFALAGNLIGGWPKDAALKSGASLTVSKISETQGQARAAGSGRAGIRLVVDPAWPIVRRADGTVDPTRPLAYGRIVPLIAPPPYSNGLAVAHTDGFPAGFAPALHRLVLEECHYPNEDPTRGRAEPTSWWWNVRVGEVVQFMGRSYTVTGPMAIPPGSGNAEGFANIGPPGTVSPLDRGDGPREWLYLANQLDDSGEAGPLRTAPNGSTYYAYGPRDGWIDSGWDGIDNNLNGLVDEDLEWEDEVFSGLPQTPWTAAPYSLQRRAVSVPAGAVQLPSSVVIDATGWGAAGYEKLADGESIDLRSRSQAPVNPYTGDVDIMFDGDGLPWFPSYYGRPAQLPGNAAFLHLWVADRGDVHTPTVLTPGGRLQIAPFPAAAAIVSVDRVTGRLVAGEADAADPAAAFARQEGRSY